MWQGDANDLDIARDASVSGQFAQHWKLRVMALEAAMKEIADSSLRRLLAFDKSFTCADEKIGDAALFYRAQRKKSAPRWTGGALKMDIDETGVAARLGVRKKGAEKDAEGAELDPLRERIRRIGADLGSQPRQVDVEKDMEVDMEDGNHTSSTGPPESDSGP